MRASASTVMKYRLSCVRLKTEGGPPKTVKKVKHQDEGQAVCFPDRQSLFGGTGGRGCKGDRATHGRHGFRITK